MRLWSRYFSTSRAVHWPWLWSTRNAANGHTQANEGDGWRLQGLLVARADFCDVAFDVSGRHQICAHRVAHRWQPIAAACEEVIMDRIPHHAILACHELPAIFQATLAPGLTVDDRWAELLAWSRGSRNAPLPDFLPI